MTDNRCKQCGDPLFASDETLISFCGGAYVDSAVERTPKSLTAFLDFSWRSPFSQGEGGKLEVVHLMESSSTQFEFDFCTLACLRSYLKKKVDSLEHKSIRWYEERMRFLLRTTDRSTAVKEWKRYFGTSLEEAEKVIKMLES